MTKSDKSFHLKPIQLRLFSSLKQLSNLSAQGEFVERRFSLRSPTSPSPHETSGKDQPKKRYTQTWIDRYILVTNQIIFHQSTSHHRYTFEKETHKSH